MDHIASLSQYDRAVLGIYAAHLLLRMHPYGLARRHRFAYRYHTDVLFICVVLHTQSAPARKGGFFSSLNQKRRDGGAEQSRQVSLLLHTNKRLEELTNRWGWNCRMPCTFCLACAHVLRGLAPAPAHAPSARPHHLTRSRCCWELLGLKR